MLNGEISAPNECLIGAGRCERLHRYMVVTQLGRLRSLGGWRGVWSEGRGQTSCARSRMRLTSDGSDPLNKGHAFVSARLWKDHGNGYSQGYGLESALCSSVRLKGHVVEEDRWASKQHLSVVGVSFVKTEEALRVLPVPCGRRERRDWMICQPPRAWQAYAAHMQPRQPVVTPCRW